MGELMALALLCTMAAAVLFQPALMGPPRRRSARPPLPAPALPPPVPSAVQPLPARDKAPAGVE